VRRPEHAVSSVVSYLPSKSHILFRYLLDGLSGLELYVGAENEGHRETVMAPVTMEGGQLKGELILALGALGTDPAIALARSYLDLNLLNEHARYFLDGVQRIINSAYTVTQEDVQHFHAMHEGVVEVTLPWYDGVLRYVDPRQRTDIKKWSSCFESVDSVFVLASLAEYDETVPGDPSSVRELNLASFLYSDMSIDPARQVVELL
jgi:hypothetical protein